MADTSHLWRIFYGVLRFVRQQPEALYDYITIPLVFVLTFLNFRRTRHVIHRMSLAIDAL